MIPGIFKIVSRSFKFYRRQALYQMAIIALLSAVITGSLLTGRSVRTSLKKTASERLGNTGIMISSGARYFDASLAERILDSARINCSGILELSGFCQSLISQKSAFGVHIYAVNSDFFSFQGNDSLSINPGEVAVNKRLADYIGLKTGDELIIHFNNISDIPADAPFAPSKGAGRSVVKKVGRILESVNSGNFSLSISQIMPVNIFINLSDLADTDGKAIKINRLLVDNRSGSSTDEIYNMLKLSLRPSDIGLSLRTIRKTGETELTSDRIFIDSAIIRAVEDIMPGSAPVITYLGNRFKSVSGSTPYSFVAALPSSLYPEISQGDGIIINRWLADDLAANKGDTIEMFWYAPDSLNKLIESHNQFVIKRIVDMEGIWSDSLLMPDFPGIAGSESCSEWDAGVPIKMDDIRHKDEDYWNKFRGTPKAFINYEKGKEMWGNNFGPASSIRFPAGISEKEIELKLSGSLDPDKAGFMITDLSGESFKAANESVDFSTLFISLGFFLILASVVLLSLAIASYFDLKKVQINTYFALGFKNKWIKRLLFLESGLIALTGCTAGAFAGFFVNIFIINALNSVWRGAVQTNTIETFLRLTPILTGFITTFIITMGVMMVKITRFLNKLNRKEKEIYSSHSPKRNLIFLLITSFTTVVLFLLSFLYQDKEVTFCFAAGTILLISMILLLRQYFTGWIAGNSDNTGKRKSLSGLYFSFYPSHAVTPVLFIAAGIFAVFITGANRMNFDGEHLKRSGGTGGYLLWCENTIPVREDLNSEPGRKATGLDDEQLREMRFVQAKRSPGNDASCLNLNHITAPPLLGIDPGDFISGGSFSFSKALASDDDINLWQYLNTASQNNTIYGIADQTVLQWGLKIKPGDTLMLRAENGQPLNIIIAAGLKSSVFQGYVLIGMENFAKYYPSVSGSSVMLIDGDPKLIDLYKSSLKERFENYGIIIQQSNDRLASFYEVTNTYLSVFGVFGALGMITGVAGLGFVLLRSYNQRKQEFALMLATGFPVKKIRRMILSEQMLILFAGVVTGVISAITATLPSLTSNSDISWKFLFVMVSAIVITGLGALFFSVRAVSNDSLTASLRRD
jgi:putative ABC transport system permease protein